jgi:NOL1/NOP2/sun family putative RNA methylase
MTRDSLAIAIEALSWMDYEGVGERTALFRAGRQLDVKEPADLRQAFKIIMETSRFRNRLDVVVRSALGSRQLEGIPHGISSLLRIVTYLKYIDSASRGDLIRTVRWGRDILGWREIHPFENAIGLLASGNLPVFNVGLTEVDRLALETCNPAWFVERTIRVFGRDLALRILWGNLSRLPSYVRLNTLAVADADDANRIVRQIKGSRVTSVDGTWKIEKSPDLLTGTDLIRSGLLVTQDLASIVAGLVADVKPGQSVLDLCAAPGNKTSHLAALMNNRGEICSIDVSKSRLAYWKKQMQRTKVAITEAIRADGANPPVRRKVEVAMVDPPCSNSGVFAKNPSIKWRLSPAKVKDYATRQYSLLNAAANQVDSHGTLVYCTCSILPEENEFVIENFLRRRQDFQLTAQVPFFGSPGLMGLQKCQRFYPHLHDCDGYFIAKMRRII